MSIRSGSNVLIGHFVAIFFNMYKSLCILLKKNHLTLWTSSGQNDVGHIYVRIKSHYENHHGHVLWNAFLQTFDSKSHTQGTAYLFATC
jgi:hypothetical protein